MRKGSPQREPKVIENALFNVEKSLYNFTRMSPKWNQKSSTMHAEMKLELWSRSGFTFSSKSLKMGPLLDLILPNFQSMAVPETPMGISGTPRSAEEQLTRAPERSGAPRSTQEQLRTTQERPG